MQIPNKDVGSRCKLYGFPRRDLVADEVIATDPLTTIPNSILGGGNCKFASTHIINSTLMLFC